ncbi:GTPase [Neobacillus jeddahensis]|uniref:GTPase n=1 Tax=Neobacillus jeddahensis TaxID=1461580 RepID=UPI000694DA4D|nr:GTPase [Neobacillus jeddahensis]
MSTIYDEIERLKKDLENDQDQKLKIALFGQPGAGKSSLINKIVGRKVANTGQGTDITVDAQIIEHNDLILVDLPGYGTSKFAPNRWFEKFEPEQYDLFLCVFSGKFHESDSTFFKQLKSKDRVCLFVRNKHDDIWEDGKEIAELEEEITQDVQKQVGTPEQVFFVSCRRDYGLDRLMDGIRQSLEPAKRDKYVRSAKAYTLEHIEKKRASCESMVYKYAGLAAANGLNPIPGVNIGVDISVMMKLFTEIRTVYGLTDDRIKSLAPTLMPLSKKIIDFASKEGVILLLKRYADKEIVKQIGRYIPFVGQAIAAVAGFGMTLSAGKSYLEDCHTLAEKILEEELSVSSR